MDDRSRRLASLTAEQRQLLALRLKKKDARQQPAPGDAETPIEDARRNAVSAEPQQRQAVQLPKPAGRGMQFSLRFFSDDGSSEAANKYQLLLESSAYADRAGFSGVWTPERHFQNFGGLYPNPSVLGAALAVITERMQIRAGSVALPLHHPVRVAEEWSVVDNLSHGRVGVSFASGWHPEDFALSPDSYENRRELMFSHIRTVQQLWAGEVLKLPGIGGEEVEVKLLPRPIQPRLPMWITTAGSPQTWLKAGELGANVLTGLQGQPPDELAKKITLYRDALAASGHDAQAGVVTVMLHTFIGEDDSSVRAKVKTPLSTYVRSFLAQTKNLKAQDGKTGLESLSETEKNILDSLAFEYYYDASSLLGTPLKCARIIEGLMEIGVNEIACLIDFGLDQPSIMESLHRLNELREHYRREGSDPVESPRT